jgi:hypothetical protein
MLAIVSGRRRREVPARARPQVERLEGRDCPTAPQVTLSIASVSDKYVTLSGTVTDVSPAADTVMISGGVNGMVTPASDGTFWYSATASQLGSITAVAVNPNSEASAPATVTLTSAAPHITIDSLTYGTFRNVTVSGHVTDDESVAGLTVMLGGVSGGATVKTDAGGNFVVTTSMLSLGQVTAFTTDVWGLPSNVASAQVTSNPPQLGVYSPDYQADGWVTFRGHVTDESPNGITVRFSGLPELQGKSTTADQYGNFELSVQLQAGEAGTVQAVATDWWNLNSNPGYYTVQV